MAGTRRIYAGKDFETLKSEGKSRLTRKFTDVSIDYDNDLVVMLLELIAYALENSHYFQDLQANEVFTSLAQLPGFLAKQASFHAYNPAGAVPSSGEVGVSITEAVNRTVTLEQGVSFSAENGLDYEVAQQVTWDANETTQKSVSLSQVRSRTQVFRSDGSRFQRYELSVSPNRYLTYRSLTIRVDGAEWTEVDQIADLDTEVYKVLYTASPPFIEFGDGAVGTVPSDGAEIFVEFSETAGIAGVIPQPGRFTGPSGAVVVGGQTVSFAVDPTTGEMSGGLGPERAAIVRTNIPKAEHSDGAIVVDDDFKGLVEKYRDPVFGGVSAAAAVVATSLDSDLVAATLLQAIKNTFGDSDAAIATAAASLTDVQEAIDEQVALIDADVADLLSEVDTGGTLLTETANIQAQKDIGVNSVNAADDALDSVSASTTSASTNATALRSQITAIGSGGVSDSLQTSTYNAIIALLDEIDARVATSGSIPSNVATAKSSLTDIAARLSSIETAKDEIEAAAATATAETTSIQTATAAITSQTVILSSEIGLLETNVTDPWDASLDALTELEDHLDAILTDACGPNVVSVPILTVDADGFYDAPSIGLQRNLEAFIEARKEPSVVFEVLDGSIQLVTANIEISFIPAPGEVPAKIKAAMEAEILSFAQAFEFGQRLDLDDLYDSVRDVEGHRSTNIEITGFSTTNPSTEAVIDSDGNLSIGRLEVIGRPVLTFFRKSESGAREQI